MERGLRIGLPLAALILGLAVVAPAQVGLWVSSASGVSTGGTMSVTGASALGGVTTVSAANARGLVVSRSGADTGIQIVSSGGSGTGYGIVSNTTGLLSIQHDADADPNIQLNGAANSIAFAATGGFSFSSGRINSNSAQPGFLAYLDTTDSDGGQVVFNVEVYDNASNFASGVFTAPVTGTYHLCPSIRVSSAAGENTSMTLQTSNRNYVSQSFIGAGQSQNMSFCAYADMDAGDTASVVTGASETIGALNLETFFSGRLVP